MSLGSKIGTIGYQTPSQQNSAKTVISGVNALESTINKIYKMFKPNETAK